jgi:heme/copper-type cytochrome/quinol oxidase subunit 1
MTSSLSQHSPTSANVFTEPMARSGFHNPAVPQLLGMDDVENAASSIVAFWVMFTELLPGNALIKNVTLCFHAPK